MTPEQLETLVEPVAKAIYEQWKDQPGYKPWVDYGNSDKQCEARRIAMSAIKLNEAES